MGSPELRGSTFVGREDELRVLEAEFAEAAAGRGRLGTIAGDPGIGKTRAGEEVVARATIPSGRVLWGPCPEQPGAPPYWPWRQAIRAHAAESDPGTLVTELGAGDVCRISRFPRLRTPTSGASACSTRSLRSCGAPRNARRSSSSSTIYTGPTRHRSSS